MVLSCERSPHSSILGQTRGRGGRRHVKDMAGSLAQRAPEHPRELRGRCRLAQAVGDAPVAQLSTYLITAPGKGRGSLRAGVGTMPVLRRFVWGGRAAGHRQGSSCGLQARIRSLLDGSITGGVVRCGDVDQWYLCIVVAAAAASASVVRSYQACSGNTVRSNPVMSCASNIYAHPIPSRHVVWSGRELASSGLSQPEASPAVGVWGSDGVVRRARVCRQAPGSVVRLGAILSGFDSAIAVLAQ